MTQHHKWFTKSRSNIFGFIYLNDDKACNITGVRQIKIDMDDDCVQILNGVRYIPILKNLIFLCTLQKNGFHTCFVEIRTL